MSAFCRLSTQVDLHLALPAALQLPCWASWPACASGAATAALGKGSLRLHSGSGDREEMRFVCSRVRARAWRRMPSLYGRLASWCCALKCAVKGAMQDFEHQVLEFLSGQAAAAQQPSPCCMFEAVGRPCSTPSTPPGCRTPSCMETSPRSMVRGLVGSCPWLTNMQSCTLLQPQPRVSASCHLMYLQAVRCLHHSMHPATPESQEGCVTPATTWGASDPPDGVSLQL